VIFAIESIADCWDEVMVNAEAHWHETEQFQNGEDLNPDKSRYVQYEEAGIYIQFTARDEGRLVGNCGMYVMPSMHTQQIIATEDTWFLLPEYRKGRNAIKFYNFVEDKRKEMDVVDINMTAKPANNASRVMEYLGYTMTAYQYSKHIGTDYVRSLAASGS